VQNWTVIEKVLAAVAVVVFVAVAALGVLALVSDGDDEALPEGCEGARLDSDLEAESSPVDALRIFVQSRPGDFPVDDSWVLESDDRGVFVFVSEQGGHYEVEVRDGLVRRFLMCPA
jgi:hypothetical protein